MSNEIKTQLSALMDGELDKDAARFLHKRLQTDAELAGDWSRWHVARDCLNGRYPGPASVDLVARVSAALADEPAPMRGALAGVARWAAGIAVAASVAVAALLVMPANAPAPTASDIAASVPAATSTAGSEVAPSGISERDLRPSLAPVAQTVSATQSMSLPPAVQVDPRIDAWLMRHNAAQVQAQPDSFVRYIPVVSPHRPQPQRLRVESADSAR